MKRLLKIKNVLCGMIIAACLGSAGYPADIEAARLGLRNANTIALLGMHDDVPHLPAHAVNDGPTPAVTEVNPPIHTRVLPISPTHPGNNVPVGERAPIGRIGKWGTAMTAFVTAGLVTLVAMNSGELSSAPTSNVVLSPTFGPSSTTPTIYQTCTFADKPYGNETCGINPHVANAPIDWSPTAAHNKTRSTTQPRCDFSYQHVAEFNEINAAEDKNPLADLAFSSTHHAWSFAATDRTSEFYPTCETYGLATEHAITAAAQTYGLETYRSAHVNPAATKKVRGCDFETYDDFTFTSHDPFTAAVARRETTSRKYVSLRGLENAVEEDAEIKRQADEAERIRIEEDAQAEEQRIANILKATQRIKDTYPSWAMSPIFTTAYFTLLCCGFEKIIKPLRNKNGWENTVTYVTNGITYAYNNTLARIDFTVPLIGVRFSPNRINEIIDPRIPQGMTIDNDKLETMKTNRDTRMFYTTLVTIAADAACIYYEYQCRLGENELRKLGL